MYEVPDYVAIGRAALARHRAQLDETAAAGGQSDLEFVLKGLAVELWSDVAGRGVFLVSDEQDAKRLGVRRGAIYTASEARMITRITDPAVVKEIHAYKRELNATVRECIDHKGGIA